MKTSGAGEASPQEVLCAKIAPLLGQSHEGSPRCMYDVHRRRCEWVVELELSGGRGYNRERE